MNLDHCWELRINKRQPLSTEFRVGGRVRNEWFLDNTETLGGPKVNKLDTRSTYLLTVFYTSHHLSLHRML